MPGILVSGCAGFIGTNLVSELLSAGFEVMGLDNLSTGKMSNLKPIIDHPKFEFVRGDILDFELVKRACADKAGVIHLAADARIQTSIKDPMLAWRTNMLGTGTVIEAARLAGVKRFVYAGSSSAYGLKNRPPMREDMPTDCLNPYSLSKKAGEEMCDVYHRLYGMSTVSFRFYNVTGPLHLEDGPYSTVVAIFRRQKRRGQPLTIVGDGEQRRDFTFVGDICKGLVMGLMNREVTGVINLGSGTNHSINEVAELVAPGHPTMHVEPRLGEARVTLADVTKARELLGWRPTTSLPQTLAILDEFEKRFPPSSGLIVAP